MISKPWSSFSPATVAIIHEDQGRLCDLVTSPRCFARNSVTMHKHWETHPNHDTLLGGMTFHQNLPDSFQEKKKSRILKKVGRVALALLDTDLELDPTELGPAWPASFDTVFLQPLLSRRMPSTT